MNTTNKLIIGLAILAASVSGCSKEQESRAVVAYHDARADSKLAELKALVALIDSMWDRRRDCLKNMKYHVQSLTSGGTFNRGGRATIKEWIKEGEKEVGIIDKALMTQIGKAIRTIESFDESLAKTMDKSTYDYLMIDVHAIKKALEKKTSKIRNKEH